MARILVGVDASTHSVEALRRASEEARWRDGHLEVVYAFAPREQMAAFPVPPQRGTDKTSADDDLRRANDRLGAWLEQLDVDLSALEVTWHVVPDRKPARALVERSADADLVVVGYRGHGGFRGLRLGSTSEQVVRHALCPVLVVRPSTKQPAEPA